MNDLIRCRFFLFESLIYRGGSQLHLMKVELAVLELQGIYQDKSREICIFIVVLLNNNCQAIYKQS